MDETCGRCRFFVRGTPGQAGGACRGRPPVPMMAGMVKHPISGEVVPRVLTFWPEVLDTLWCGDFVRKPLGASVDLSKLAVEELEGQA